MFKPAALGIACLTILFMIIGIATPQWTTEFTYFGNKVTQTYGCRDTTSKSAGGTTTTNRWTEDCSTDKCKQAKAMSQSGFAFIFMGMLLNIALIISLVKANGYGTDMLPSPLGEKMPTAGICGVLLLFNLIGTVLTITALHAGIDTSSTVMQEADENKKLGFGAFLLIISLFSTVGAGVLAFLGMNDDTESVAAPAGALEVEATRDDSGMGAGDEPPVAPDYGDDAPPPGGVYMKNGTWLDKDDNPIK